MDTLKSRSIVDQLHWITMPALVIDGLYGEAPDLCVISFV